MNEEFMVNLGNIVKKIRKNLGITQTELGEKVDRPQSSIARLESGQLGDTHFGFIIDLAKALEMNAEDLVAKAFGRDFRPSTTSSADRMKTLMAIKQQLIEADPSSKKLAAELFSQLSEWFLEVTECFFAVFKIRLTCLLV